MTNELSKSNDQLVDDFFNDAKDRGMPSHVTPYALAQAISKIIGKTYEPQRLYNKSSGLVTTIINGKKAVSQEECVRFAKKVVSGSTSSKSTFKF